MEAGLHFLVTRSQPGNQYFKTRHTPIGPLHLSCPSSLSPHALSSSSQGSSYSPQLSGLLLRYSYARTRHSPCSLGSVACARLVITHSPAQTIGLRHGPSPSPHFKPPFANAVQDSTQTTSGVSRPHTICFRQSISDSRVSSSASPYIAIPPPRRNPPPQTTNLS